MVVTSNWAFSTEQKENSIEYYVGIRYRKVPNDKIVWVANRDSAFESPSAVLTIQPDGNMEITDGRMMYHDGNFGYIFERVGWLMDERA
ncbi:hypothetical protein Fmac_021198 [Flemingia macrophylla]|uniref:Bulb-type lectin domain-containing protein n=1 Tax=Flemingia macrophylla TaxID=520843 RepID=A0ABD1LWC9_9FABA